MVRFPQRPIVWTIVLSSLGWAALAANPACARSEDAPGHVHIRSDQSDDPSGHVRIRSDGPSQPAGRVRIRNLDSVPPRAVAARIKYATPQKLTTARPAPPPLRNVVVSQPTPASSFSLAVWRYSYGPAPTGAAPWSHNVILANGESTDTTPDCPAVSDEDVRAFGSGIDAATERRPIASLKADMKMRLSQEHSSLMDEHDRAIVRETGRCAAENDRLVVQRYYLQKYGPGYDRSSYARWDACPAPSFPFSYHPLYFEDPNLERCGYSQGCLCQSAISGFQFYGNVALLPIKMLLLPPCSCVYPQPDCEPCLRYSCCDNMLGPFPERLFRSPCYSSRRWR
jgi:hypothetical protein